MRARSIASRSIFLFRTRAGYVESLRTNSTSSTRPAWRYHVPRIWNRSINVCEFPVKRKTQNVVDVFVLRLFVVVPFLSNCCACNHFPELTSRATLAASNETMRRAVLILPLVFAPMFFAHLSAQERVKPSTPSSMRSAYGEKLRIEGVPNSGRINDHLYRGAQPRDPGLDELKKLGITTIVNLRDEDAPKISWEEKRAESLGIRFVHIAVNEWSPPTNEQVAQFLSIFRDNPQEKVFVHCHYGEDRTGVFVASYRMAFEKLPADQALKEMHHFGYNGLWHPAMTAFVRDFPSRLNTAPPLAPFKSKD